MKVQLHTDTRGVVFVEHLISYLPVIFFFLATWQLIELCAAHLIVQRAASAAARAAIVVLPDDPAFYVEDGKEAGCPKDQMCGQRATDVKLAAGMILRANPHFSEPTVEIAGAAGAGPLTATVRANFHCFAGWASLVCGADGYRVLSAKSSYLYQGASFSYEL